jgi:hypothetical protein
MAESETKHSKEPLAVVMPSFELPPSGASPEHSSVWTGVGQGSTPSYGRREGVV